MGEKMKGIDWQRLVVVSSMHGERYLGSVSWTVSDPKKYLEERGQAGLPIRLHDVRNLLGQVSPRVDAEGKLAGFSRMMVLLPLEMINGPLPELYVIPSSWYFPGENGDECKKLVTKMIEEAAEAEIRASATAAGLHLVTGPLPPGQKS